MRILFMGTPDIAAECLKALYSAGHDICAVYTRRDKPVGRKQVLTAPPVKEVALEHGTPVFQPRTLRDGSEDANIRALAPELIVVVAYGCILPKSVLELPKYGCINLHVSLLPKYRGSAPVQWSVLNGDAETGVSIMQMDEGLDTGDVLRCEKMKLGEADASGRRSPVGSGEFFDIPCDLVISAVGEQVDSALMAANGIEVDKKGRPAFQTNLPGVYAAGDATRGPATVVEGIADAARFAQEVIGQAYTYDIPQQAYITRTDAQAKKGILNMSGCVCQEGSRCLQCSTVCENCVDSCPNRANVAIAMADGSHQILHVDKMCNECGNCAVFCPYDSAPYREKFTLFLTREGFDESTENQGFLPLEGRKVLVRLDGKVFEADLDGQNQLPADVETFILTVLKDYAYLL